MSTIDKQSLEVSVELDSVTIYISLCNAMLKKGVQCIVTPHIHSSFELCYVADGSGNYVTHSGMTTTKKGDIIIVHPGEFHYQSEKKIDDSLVQYYMELRLKQPKANASAKKASQYNEILNFLNSINIVSDPNMSLLPYLEKILNEFSDKKMGYAEKCQSLITSFMIDLMRIGNYKNSSNVFKNFGTANSSSLERNVQLFFSTQYKYNVTLQNFADSLCLSPRQASRIIKQKYGVSFLENLFKVRVQYAKIMIENTDKSLDEIQNACGFKNYKSFLTNFRKYTGKSPATYKSLIDKKKGVKNEHQI